MQSIYSEYENNLNNLDYTFINPNSEFSLNETFSTTALDYRKWNYTTQIKTSIAISGNKFNITHVSGQNYINDFALNGSYSLVGNFAIEFSYSGLLGFSNTNSRILGLIVYDKSNPNVYNIELSKIQSATGRAYKASVSNGIDSYLNTFADTQTAGKMKLVKSENMIRGYVQVGTAWNLILERDITGFPDNLAFKFSSGSAASGSGFIALSNILINNSNNYISEQFTSTFLNLDAWNLTLQDTSTHIISNGVLNLQAIGTSSKAEIVSRNGISVQDFSAQMQINTALDSGTNNEYYFKIANNYNTEIDGLVIKYITDSVTANNKLSFIQILNSIETEIAFTTTGIISTFALKIERVANDFTAYYKSISSQTWTTIGTFNSSSLNNYKNIIIGTKKDSSAGNTSMFIDNFSINTSNLIEECKETFKASPTSNLINKYFKNVEQINSGISYRSGLNIGIGNSSTSIYNMQSNFALSGNFELLFELSNIAMPYISNSSFEIIFSSVLNENIYGKLSITKNSTNKQELQVETSDSSLINSSINYEYDKVFLKISRINYSYMKYEYSLDGLTYTAINETNNAFENSDDMFLNINLKNSALEYKGSSVSIKRIKINKALDVFPFNTRTLCDYKSGSLDTSIIKNAINNDEGTLINFNSNLITNTGIFRKNSPALANPFISATSLQNWIVVSSTAFSALQEANFYKISTNANNGFYELETDHYLELGEHIVKFGMESINKIIGVTFCEYSYTLEDGRKYVLKLVSDATPNKQKLVAERYDNYNFITPVETNSVLLTYNNDDLLTQLKFKANGGVNIQLQYYVQTNPSDAFITLATYSLQETAIKGKISLKTINNSTEPLVITYYSFSSNINYSIGNHCLNLNNLLNNYIQLPKSYFNKRDEFTAHWIFSTYRDPLTIRNIYTEHDALKYNIKLEKTTANVFRIIFKNHFNLDFSMQSLTKNFSTLQDWMITLTFSKTNGYKLYVNGALEASSNTGFESPVLIDSSSFNLFKDFANIYFKGKFHQFVVLEEEQTLTTIQNFYNSTNSFISKTAFIKGSYI